MTTYTDSRQIWNRAILTRTTGVVDSTLDTVFPALDSEITPPLALSAAGTLVITIGSIKSTNPSTLLNRTVAPINSLIPIFTSGTVTLPSAGSGSAVPSSGSSVLLGMAASQYLLLGMALDSTGAIHLTTGTAASSLAAAGTPSVPSNTFAIGYVVVQTNASNVVQNVTASSLYQYEVSAGVGSTLFLDSQFIIENASDITKQIEFSASGSSTGTTTTIASSSTANHTLTLPNFTDTLAVLAGAQTLTNKTLVAQSTVIQDSVTTTKNLEFVLTSSIANSTTIIATAATATTVTLTLPSTSDTIVGRATADTLTNKILSGNTSTNFVNGSGVLDINTTGTITIPNGTDTLVGLALTQTLTNKVLSGNTASGFINSAGVFNINSTGTITVPNGTDTLAGIALAQTLTNKTLTAPIMSNYADFTEIATPSNPSAGVLRVYSKSGDNLYILNSSGTESELVTTALAVTLTGSQTLTNKNLTSTTNSFTAYAPNSSSGTSGVVNGTQGLAGFTDGSGGSAGYVGETLNTVVGPTSYALSGGWTDATSFNLTAGSWILFHQGYFHANSANYGNCFVAISTNSGNSGVGLVMGDNQQSAGTNNNNGYDLSAGIFGYRINISSTTTYYAKIYATYSGGSPNFSSRFTAVRIR